MTPFQLAHRLVNEVRERAGAEDDPFILWCLESCPHQEPLHDEVPWCSGFVNRICWLCGVQRSRSLMARSWLDVGISIPLNLAVPGYDVIVLSREGASPQSGHVGFFAGSDTFRLNVRVLGGNQGNRVSIAEFDQLRVLGVRRLEHL